MLPIQTTSRTAMPFVRGIARAGSPLSAGDSRACRHLADIIEQQQLTSLYQPIIDMDGCTILGYEGLIRGPSDSPLHSPLNLFRVANFCGLTVQVEHLCRRVVLQNFVRLGLPGKLFLNVSPECLLDPGARHGETLGYLRELGISPERVIIELTENQPTYDYDLLREAATHYRSMGFQIAIDDLGEGFSSLRLWSELRPEFVKIDMHFIQGINQDPVKLQFVRSIQEIARNSDSRVIAEGIETRAELLVVKDLGIAHGQGYFIARPSSQPAAVLPPEVAKALGSAIVPVYPSAPTTFKTVTAAKLARYVAPVKVTTLNDDVYEIFKLDSELAAIPVVDGERPIGIITRYAAIDRFAHPYWRDLYGRKSCSNLMDREPVVVDKDTSIQALSQMIVAAGPRQMSNGFIVTEGGRYLGVGTSHDLMGEITRLQISAARYANPLTQLPGNVPISEHIDRLIEGETHFVACYCDLDHFKPFNDVHGYRKGDDAIQLVANLLVAHCDPHCDFVGHIGGDDFVILFQSEDWGERCEAILAAIPTATRVLFTPEDRERGGYFTEDRQGKKIFFPLLTLSIGAVVIEPQRYHSHHQVSAAMAEAKREAKKAPGNNLFVERRRKP